MNTVINVGLLNGLLTFPYGVRVHLGRTDYYLRGQLPFRWDGKKNL
jgi:hypothetical protein